MINWVSSICSSVRDYTPGSVIRTILESVAQEIDELYSRTYNGIREAQAEGAYAAFDFPLKPAQSATGMVTFYQDGRSNDIKSIPMGTVVSTTGTTKSVGTQFQTTETKSLDITQRNFFSVKKTENVDSYYLVDAITGNLIRMPYRITSVIDNEEQEGIIQGNYVEESSLYSFTLADHDFEFGTGEFTIDFWMFINSSSSGSINFIKKRLNDGNYLVGSVGDTSAAFSLHINNVVIFNYAFSGSTLFQRNTWVHIALVRSGSNAYLFINGTPITWTTASPALQTSQVIDIYDTEGIIRCNYIIDNVGATVPILIDEYRVSKGVARWTSAFTPPSGPYDIIGVGDRLLDSYVKLLLHCDSFGSNFVDSSFVGRTNMVITDVTQTNSPSPKFGISSASFLTSEGSSIVIPVGQDFELTESNGQTQITWIGKHPNDNSNFTGYAYSKSIDVSVVALNPGLFGNVAEGEIININSVVNVELKVNNFDNFIDGTEEETKDQRKARFASFVAGLSRGTIGALRYAIFNKTFLYKVTSAVILDAVPGPGFVTIYVADSTATASEGMINEVVSVIQDYQGIGVTIGVKSATRVNIDVRCRVRILNTFNPEIMRSAIKDALVSHLNKYTFRDDSPYSTVYLTNLDYIIKSTRLGAVLEADIRFKRNSVTPLTKDDFATDTYIKPIKPVIRSSEAQLFRAGNVDVFIIFYGTGAPSNVYGISGDYYEDIDSEIMYTKLPGSSVWTQE
jgi:uncharacterized phage protein gp47/JayE